MGTRAFQGDKRARPATNRCQEAIGKFDLNSSEELNRELINRSMSKVVLEINNRNCSVMAIA